MKYSRRDFIRIGGLAIGFSALVPIPAFGNRAIFDDNFSLQLIETFQNLVGSEFTFYRSDSAVTGVLAEVTPFEVQTKKSSIPPFSMVFELPLEGFPQETYEVFHPSLGKFELFAVSGTSKKGVPLLIAVVNITN